MTPKEIRHEISLLQTKARAFERWLKQAQDKGNNASIIVYDKNLAMVEAVILALKKVLGE